MLNSLQCVQEQLKDIIVLANYNVDGTISELKKVLFIIDSQPDTSPKLFIRFCVKTAIKFKEIYEDTTEMHIRLYLFLKAVLPLYEFACKSCDEQLDTSVRDLIKIKENYKIYYEYMNKLVSTPDGCSLEYFNISKYIARSKEIQVMLDTYSTCDLKSKEEGE
jgi:hypothetical protein